MSHVVRDKSLEGTGGLFDTFIYLSHFMCFSIETLGLLILTSKNSCKEQVLTSKTMVLTSILNFLFHYFRPLKKC